MHFREASIAVESALAVGELLAQTEIRQCQPFEQLMVYLRDAVEALAKAEAEGALVFPEHTVFPTPEAANDRLKTIEPADDVAYRLSRSGDGRCVIQVFKLSGVL